LGEHFNWLLLVPGVTHHNLTVAVSLAVGLLLIVLSFSAKLALGTGEKAISPAAKFSLKGVIELITEFIIGLSDTVIGEEGRKFVPMFAAIFLYIWVNNLIGLLPGVTPATDDLNMTMAVGLFSFFTYNFFALREHGIGYIKHFIGPMLWMAPLMLPIELLSHLVRPFTLGLRLQANIMADHTVLSIFLGMFEKMWFIPVPAIFYGMGIFVASMQAFVFTLLSMVYVSMAIAHDH
jgi:F-type H+-transporting ATPase subunit a